MIIIKTSSDNFDAIEKICKNLIGQRLAVCANVIPNCHSYFFWEGEINEYK